MINLIEIGLMSYNQVEGLTKTINNLEEILNHPENYKHNINIFISDNASNDNSWEKIIEFQKRYPDKIKTNFHDRNTEFFGNFIYLIENMKSQFGLILGCGDELKIDNFIWFLNELDAHRQDNPSIAMCVLGEYQNSLENNFEFKLANSPIRISEAVSCNVFNLTLINKISFESPASKIWPHLYLGLNIILNSKEVMFCEVESGIVILDRPINGWYTSPDFFRILELRDYILFSKESVDAGLSGKYVELKHQGKQLASLIYRNRKLAFFKMNKEISFEIFKTYRNNWLILVYVFAMSYMPIHLIRFVSRISKIVIPRYNQK
jgi:hypothetical protein